MRIWTLLYQTFIGWIISSIVIFFAFILAPIDLLLQLITGWEIFASNGTIFGYVNRTLTWNAGQIGYGLTGAGRGFKWIP